MSDELFAPKGLQHQESLMEDGKKGLEQSLEWACHDSSVSGGKLRAGDLKK
jgi:hypothetical protein